MTTIADADRHWVVASAFVRDVIEALGYPQPAPDAIVDLSAIALQVVGQIEELKVQNADLLAVARDVFEYLHGQLSPCEPDCECLLHALEAAIVRAEGR